MDYRAFTGGGKSPLSPLAYAPVNNTNDFLCRSMDNSWRHHLWRSRSGILPAPWAGGTGSTSHTYSSTTSHRRLRACAAGNAAESGGGGGGNSAPGRPSGARTYRVDDGRRAPECLSSRPPPRALSAPAVVETAAAAQFVLGGGEPGRRYRNRSFRYSRLHRRTIDAIVPEELRRLPQQWATRAAQQMPPNSASQ